MLADLASPSDRLAQKLGENLFSFLREWILDATGA